MSFVIAADSVDADVLELAQDKLLGYPARGVDVGGGVHVTSPESWSGAGRIPVGWSSYRGSSFPHPTDGRYAVPIDNASPASINNGRLVGQERATFISALNSRGPLPPGWVEETGGQRAKQ